MESDDSEEEEVIILTVDKNGGFQNRCGIKYYYQYCEVFFGKVRVGSHEHSDSNIISKVFTRTILCVFSSKLTSSPGGMDLSLALRATNKSKDDNARNNDNKRRKRKNKPKKRTLSGNS